MALKKATVYLRARSEDMFGHTLGGGWKERGRRQQHCVTQLLYLLRPSREDIWLAVSFTAGPCCLNLCREKERMLK